jgi:dolichyl-phosphate-mannose--protein O-mannosyl transferase
LLFGIALAPRLPGLGRFLTSDENTNIFFAGSDVIVAFLRGDFRGTYWHFYPGVTMSWLDALGMGGQDLLAWLSGANLPPFSQYVYGDILSLLVANRLPYAILTAAAIPAIYWLARQLLPERVALLGALFLAFDPFYLAHSRVDHGDAPLAVFMSLSALTFRMFAARFSNSAIQRINSNQSFLSSLLIASAILGGLAALTKTPGPFMAIFIIGMSVIYARLELHQVSGSNTTEVSDTPHYALRTTHHA